MDGRGADSLIPIKIMDDVVAVSAGQTHTMAIKSDGTLWGWGFNSFGEIGDGVAVTVVKNGLIPEDNYRFSPVQIMEDVAAVSAGHNHTIAIKTDGSLWGWGKNDACQLGDGAWKNRLAPIKIMENIAAVAGGESHTLAIGEDGSLWGWGSNNFACLGDGTWKVRNKPIKITNEIVSSDDEILEQNISVTLNGKYIEFDQPPVIIGGRTLVPIRAVCEKLGADVYWLEQAQGVLVIKNEIKLALTVGNNQMVKFTAENFSEYLEKAEDINFEPEAIYLDVPPRIIGDRTLLPIRAVCEALGAEVDWNGESNTVIITCSDEIINDKNRDTTFFDSLVAFIDN